MAKKYFFSSIRPYVLKDRRINLLPRILCLQKYFDDWKWNLEYKISTWIIVKSVYQIDGSQDDSLYVYFLYFNKYT